MCVPLPCALGGDPRANADASTRPILAAWGSERNWLYELAPPRGLRVGGLAAVAACERYVQALYGYLSHQLGGVENRVSPGAENGRDTHPLEPRAAFYDAPAAIRKTSPSPTQPGFGRPGIRAHRELKNALRFPPLRSVH